MNLLTACGLCVSNGEARRLVQQGGISVNDAKVTAADAVFEKDAFAGDGIVIKKGKKSLPPCMFGLIFQNDI